MAFWTKGFSHNNTPDCKKCRLERTLRSFGYSDFMQESVVGNGKKGILIVAPPRHLHELRLGRKYENDHIGDMLRDMLSPHVDLYDDCWIIPALKCPPVDAKGGDVDEYARASCCRAWIETTAKELKPSVVILMGEVAVDTWYGGRLDKVSVGLVEGDIIPDHTLGAWVCPMRDVQSVLLDKNEAVPNIYYEMLQNAVLCTQMEPPVKVDYDNMVRVLTEYQDVVDVLNRVIDTKPEWFDFDYETNTVKASLDGACLYSVSFMFDDETAYSMPMFGWNHFSPQQQAHIKDLYAKIMADTDIKKAAHNLQMEHSWTTTHIGVRPNWGWDTMMAQHIIDVRKGTKGLKHQAQVRYGFRAYDAYVKPFFEPDEKTHLNSIDKINVQKLLHYGGLDALFGRIMRKDQMKTLKYGTARKENRRDCFLNLYLPGMETMAELSMQGFRVDIPHFEKWYKDLRAEQEVLAQEIQSDPAVVAVSRMVKEGVFKLGSGYHVSLLLEELGVRVDKRTASGAVAVDKDVLEDLHIPVLQTLLKWRKREKLCNTYIKAFLNESSNSVIHPDYRLTTARSGRSSSASPNFQNLSKRDKWAKDIVKNGLFAQEGYHMAEIDYGSLEVRIFTCSTKDPVLIDYLVNGGDMHRDEAAHVFELTPERVHKEVRQAMKMGWVFALLYGSYYKACAAAMWEDIIERGLCTADPSTESGKGISIKAHMRAKGVRTLDDFTQWCRQKEKEFWEKFHVTHEYQERAKQTYKTTGYVDTLWGFRRQDIMSANMVINTPTQGTGFQCLLWSTNQILAQARREGWKSHMMGQIHDSLIMGIHPDEKDYVLTTVEEIMTERIKTVAPWIIVPLIVEAELSPIGGSWNSLVPYEKDESGVWKPV